MKLVECKHEKCHENCAPYQHLHFEDLVFRYSSLAAKGVTIPQQDSPSGKFFNLRCGGITVYLPLELLKELVNFAEEN